MQISPVALISRGSPPISPRACAAQGGQHAQVAVAQVGTAVGDALNSLEHPLGIEEAVGIDQEVGPVRGVDRRSMAS